MASVRRDCVAVIFRWIPRIRLRRLTVKRGSPDLKVRAYVTEKVEPVCSIGSADAGFEDTAQCQAPSARRRPPAAESRVLLPIRVIRVIEAAATLVT